MYLSKFRLRTNESTSPRFTRGHRHTPISQPVKTFISHCGQDTAPPDVDIGLLIGRNVPAAFQPIKVIFGNDEEPWAEQYKFGWTIIGRVCRNKHPTSNAASVNRVIVEREMLLDRCEELSITPPFKNLTNSKDLTSPKQVRLMMELDYSEIHHSRKIRGTEQSEFIGDKRFGVILTKGLYKNTNGNWQAPAPFKSDDISLPDNKGHCLRRLLSLKRRLLNNNKIETRLDNGHTSRVPDDQLSTEKGKAWFLPHKETRSNPSRV